MPVCVESSVVWEGGHVMVGKAVHAMTRMNAFLLGSHSRMWFRKMNWPVCWPLGNVLLAFGKQLVNDLSALFLPSQTSL